MVVPAEYYPEHQRLCVRNLLIKEIIIHSSSSVKNDNNNNPAPFPQNILIRLLSQNLMTDPQHDSNQQPLRLIEPENVWQMNRSVPCPPPSGPVFSSPRRMSHGSNGGRLERLSVSGGGDMVLKFTILLSPNRWTDCHELNPAAVCPSPPCIYMTSVMLWR